jgi:alkylation response protein AidB-like acyl-CoA dehydrogenase
MSLTADQQQISDIARRIVPDRTAARALLDGDLDTTAVLWRQLANVGLTGLGLPEAWSGGGFGLAEQAIALETLGYMAAPAPLVSAFLATAIFRSSDSATVRDMVGRAVEGAERIGACLPAELEFQASISVRALGNGTAELSGEIPYAHEAAHLDVFVVHAAGQWWSIEKGTAQVEIIDLPSLDPLRRCPTLKFASATAMPVASLEQEGVLALAWTLIAAESVGLAQAALDMAREYALQRQQFGQPIGRFQAIKHKLTDMLIAVEGARSAVHGAVRSAVHEIPAERAARMAKAVATEAAVKVIAEAIQIHGAIGNTWEVDLHLLYRRAKANQLILGSPDSHMEKLADALIEAPRQEKSGRTNRSATAVLADMPLAEADREFIEEFRAWLDANVTPDLFASVRVKDPVERRRALRAWQARMADAGWVGIHWPKAFNGREASFTQQVLYHTEIAVRNLPRLIGNRGLSQAGPTLIAHGTEDQKRRYVEATRRADILWASGFSERGSGSDLASLRTRGVVEGDELVINGHKIWTTSAHFCDFIYTLVRTGPLVPKHDGISCVIVPTNAKGLTIRPIRRMTGIADFNECFFDDVRVPLSNVIGPINAGWRVMRTTLSHEHMTNFLGTQLKQAVTVERIVDRVRRRETTTSSVHHDLRRRIAQAWVNTQLLWLHGMRGVVQLATGREPGPEGSILKVSGQEEEKRLWELAVDVLGPAGLQTDMWTTGFLSSRGATVGGGTSEIHRNKIAERVLGMPRDLWAYDGDSGSPDAPDES